MKQKIIDLVETSDGVYESVNGIKEVREVHRPIWPRKKVALVKPEKDPIDQFFDGVEQGQKIYNRFLKAFGG